MKSYKELLNELASKGGTQLRELTPEESCQLKREILNIYKDVFKICNENGLTLMLCGGSCLGAIRHKGFIPWDDDLDVLMPREDYNRFRDLCKKGMLGDKYEYSYPDKEHDSPAMFMKIFKKGTKNIEMGSESSPFPKGIFLDIFILDGAPSNKFSLKFKGLIANTLRLISNMVMSSQYPSEIQAKFVSLDTALNRQYKMRLFIGKIFSVISHKTWVYLYDKFVENNRKTGLVTIPTGRKLYVGEALDSNVFFPVRESQFEGVKVFIPNDFHKYLSNLYKDYMKIPPIEKRERHFIVEYHN